MAKDCDYAERLATAMLVLHGAEDAETTRHRARLLIAEVRASPLNPHGDDVGAIVDELIDTIEVLRGETWRDIQRVLVRGVIKGI